MPFALAISAFKPASGSLSSSSAPSPPSWGIGSSCATGPPASFASDRSAFAVSRDVSAAHVPGPSPWYGRAVGEPHVAKMQDDSGTRHVDEPDGP